MAIYISSSFSFLFNLIFPSDQSLAVLDRLINWVQKLAGHNPVGQRALWNIKKKVTVKKRKHVPPKTDKVSSG